MCQAANLNVLGSSPVQWIIFFLPPTVALDGQTDTALIIVLIGGYALLVLHSIATGKCHGL